MWGPSSFLHQCPSPSVGSNNECSLRTEAMIQLVKCKDPSSISSSHVKAGHSVSVTLVLRVKVEIGRRPAHSAN